LIVIAIIIVIFVVAIIPASAIIIPATLFPAITALVAFIIKGLHFIKGDDAIAIGIKAIKHRRAAG
jgi:hypothetical protein